MKKNYKVGVVGAGNMGSGIAQKMAQEGLNVTLVDMKDEYVERGLNIIKNMLKEGVDRGIFTEEKAEETLGRIKGTSSYEDLKDSDLVVEAIFEDKKAKGDLFVKLDKICDEKTVLATNTSSFYVEELAKRTNRPDRVLGMHYFYHPAKNRLLEVIPHEGTSEETTELALLIGKLHGKTNITVKDSPGFAVNRFFVPFLVSSVRAVEDGVADIATVEYGAKEAFGIGMGPYELMNVTGIPIAVHAANTLGNEVSPFYMPPKLLVDQNDSGKLWNFEGEVDKLKIQEVKDFLYGATLGAACQLVDEEVASIEDIDRGAKIGLRWKIGPFQLINKIGVEKAYENVKKINEKYPDFKVAKVLKEQSKKGVPFIFNFVDLSVEENIAYIKVNRPEAMNALNETVVSQLEDKFNLAEKDENVDAVVIEATGKTFIAGADIKFFVDNIKNDTIDKNVSFTVKGHEILRRLETSNKKTIALVDGLSLGGGSEVAFACQYIVATEEGSFGFPETGIGIYPGLGGMIRMERHLGKELAKYYVLTGKSLPAKTAHDLGIVTELVEPTGINKAIKNIVEGEKIDKYRERNIPEKFEEYKKIFKDENLKKLLSGNIPQNSDKEKTDKIKKILSRKAPLAIKIADELIDAQSEVDIDKAIELELDRLVEMFSTSDALKGLSARPGSKVEYEGK